MLIPRIKELQDKYQIPFLLENIAQLIPNYKTGFSDAQFLNVLTEATGCSLILDVYNLQCDAYNFNFDIDAFLKELNLLSVKEIHIAGGVIQDGFQLDIHTRRVADSTIDLTKQVLDKEHGAEVVLYEILPEAVEVFGQNMVIEELDRLSEVLNIKK